MSLPSQIQSETTSTYFMTGLIALIMVMFLVTGAAYGVGASDSGAVATATAASNWAALLPPSSRAIRPAADSTWAP